MTIRAVPPEIAALPKVAHLCNYSLKDTFNFGKHTSKRIKIAGVELYIDRTLRYIKWVSESILSEQHKIWQLRIRLWMHMCQVAELGGELIYVQGTDIEASSSNAKTFFHI